MTTAAWVMAVPPEWAGVVPDEVSEVFPSELLRGMKPVLINRAERFLFEVLPQPVKFRDPSRYDLHALWGMNLNQPSILPVTGIGGTA